MIYLRMTDLLLTPPITQTSADWQVSTDLIFSPINIIAQSLGDATNLTAILFNNTLDPGIKYYARGRLLLSTGYTAWSNIDVFTPDSVIAPNGVSSALTPLPSLVTLPQITVTNAGINTPIFNTTITISQVTTLGGAKHTSTSYVVEDIYGNPKWADIHSVTNKLSLTIPSDVLSPNSVYRIRILINTDSKDTSQLLTTTIKTESSINGLILNNLDVVSASTDLVIDVMPIGGITGSIGELYAIINKKNILVNTYIGGGASGMVITIPANDMLTNTKHILRINTTDINIWDQRVFVTTL